MPRLLRPRSSRRRPIRGLVLRARDALNLVHLHAYVPPGSPVPGERPRTSALARYQAASGDGATSLRHPGAARGDLEGEIERWLRDLAGQAMVGA
jgi:hypothetical protein